MNRTMGRLSRVGVAVCIVAVGIAVVYANRFAVSPHRFAPSKRQAWSSGRTCHETVTVGISCWVGEDFRYRVDSQRTACLKYFRHVPYTRQAARRPGGYPSIGQTCSTVPARIA